MRLVIGERLAGSGPVHQPGGYIVTEVLQETPWYGLYAGKKILYNFDFTSKRARETNENEWLDVCLRTIEYPRLDDPKDVVLRRALARAEAQYVLGTSRASLWPELVDLLDLPNNRDPFQFSEADYAAAADTQQGILPGHREPILVFARSHGQAMPRWQSQVLPLSSLLAVAAEVLGFLEQAHSEGFVLQSIDPQQLVVDRARRVHYLGSHIALADTQHIGLTPFDDLMRNGKWSKFFSAERYPRGYAAPECFLGDHKPDAASDLYSWGMLVCSLLTGDRPNSIASEQRRFWAHFDEAHFARLERSFRGVPPAHVRTWAEQLGVEPAKLIEGWPGNMIAVFRSLLHPENARRPQSVEQLRSWILTPPATPIAAALAIRIADEKVRLFFDLPERHLEIKVCRGKKPSSNIDDGETIAAGMLQSPVVDEKAILDEDVYSFFTLDKRAGNVSTAVSAKALNPTTENILELAEESAARGSIEQAEPPRVTLLFRALSILNAAEALLASELPQVRSWAIDRLKGIVTDTGQEDGEMLARTNRLLRRSLHDSAPHLRYQAAAALLYKQDDDRHVQNVVQEMAGAKIDEQIQAAQLLRRAGVATEAVERLIDKLEGDRPTTCPVCSAELAGRDRADHMQEAHDHINVFGVFLPRQQAIALLWERVFEDGDSQAHERLLGIGHARASQEHPFSVYVESLESQLSPSSARQTIKRATRTKVGRLVESLKFTADKRSLAAALLRSKEDLVREIGREMLMPEISERLRGSELSAGTIRKHLDELCPADLIDEKIKICERLTSFGVDLLSLNACVSDLRAEKLTECPECGVRVQQRELEHHLRKKHGIFEFHGVRRSFVQTRDYLVQLACGPSPHYTACQMLIQIANERYRERAWHRIVLWLVRFLRGLDRNRRASAIRSLTEAMVSSDAGMSITRALLREELLPLAGHSLALSLLGRLPPPIDQEMVDAIKPSLADKRLPNEDRLAATASLLRTVGRSGRAAEELLEAYIADMGKLKAIERLQQLEGRVGQAPAIDALCTRLEDQLRMHCPRCSIELRRAEMVEHLWDRHRLMLEGRRVREPWRMIEDWIEDYRLERDEEALKRCLDLARKLDDDGEGRVQRLLLRHGIDDREALAKLLRRARETGTSLCPNCYAQIPAKSYASPPPAEIENEEMHCADCDLELMEDGFFPRLVIETPSATVYRGGEPGGRLTRLGVLSLLVGPLMLIAFFVIQATGGAELPALSVILISAGVALFFGMLLVLLWPAPPDAADRLVDHAWTLLVPDLSMSGKDWDFVAGLAQVSIDKGDPEARDPELRRLCELAENNARSDDHLAPHLARLSWLRIEDLIADKHDPIPEIVELVEGCFVGRLPLAFAGQLLEPLAVEDDWWTAGRRRRLAVLLCDSAFENGLETSDLLDLGRAQPMLGAVIGTKQSDLLGQLRATWLLRSRPPWRKWDNAVDVFELARDSGRGTRILGDFPDILLFAPRDPAFFICSRGVCFEKVWFVDMPRTIEVVEHDDNDFELIIDGRSFDFGDDPDELAERLERWFRFFFRDFVPQSAVDLERRDAEVAARIESRNGTTCPSCGQWVLTRAGEVGVTLTGNEEASILKTAEITERTSARP